MARLEAGLGSLLPSANVWFRCGGRICIGQCIGCGGGEGASKQKALRLVTTGFSKDLRLCQCLYTFGSNGDA